MSSRTLPAIAPLLSEPAGAWLVCYVRRLGAGGAVSCKLWRGILARSRRLDFSIPALRWQRCVDDVPQRTVSGTRVDAFSSSDYSSAGLRGRRGRPADVRDA